MSSVWSGTIEIRNKDNKWTTIMGTNINTINPLNTVLSSQDPTGQVFRCDVLPGLQGINNRYFFSAIHNDKRYFWRVNDDEKSDNYGCVMCNSQMGVGHDPKFGDNGAFQISGFEPNTLFTILSRNLPGHTGVGVKQDEESENMFLAANNLNAAIAKYQLADHEENCKNFRKLDHTW